MMDDRIIGFFTPGEIQAAREQIDILVRSRENIIQGMDEKIKGIARVEWPGLSSFFIEWQRKFK
jgi:hypothetical protein